MFKRILKVLAICFAILAGVGGAGVGIYALQGGFKETKINIIKLFIDDETKACKEIYTLDDISTAINFAPLNATNKELEVIVSDPLRQYDDSGELVSDGILKDVPKTITAGKTFDLKINKDEKGNNIGGVVELKFRPANDDKSITDFTLKLIVDVAIPNNSIYFSGNKDDSLSDDYTTLGKSIKMGISSATRYVYLKSELVNAFYLQANNKNFKRAEISYTYNDLKGNFIGEGNFDDLEYAREYDSETKKYCYYYKIPVTPKYSGTITLKARMHKTYEIEKDYIAGDFDNMPSSIQTVEDQAKLDRYNEFINKYIKYFDTNDENYSFFKNYMNSYGKAQMRSLADVELSKEYVFETCSTKINVSAVNLKDITSTTLATSYPVLSSANFTLSNLINKFDLEVTLDQNDVANIDTETENLFSSLKVSPWIYLSFNEYTKNIDVWKDFYNTRTDEDGNIIKYLYAVNTFNNNKPVLDSTVFIDDIANLDESSVTGFMVELNNSNYNSFITITASSDVSTPSWTMEFNVPLKNDSSTDDMNGIARALFLRFDVTGLDLITNTKIQKHTFSRIFIDYTDYEYIDDVGKIAFDNSEIKKMVINTNVQNAVTEGYAEKLYEQEVDLKLDELLVNYDACEYKSVMYFVEENSNREDQSYKVATIGKYKFKYMKSTGNTSSDYVKKFGTEEDLVGERLLNRGSLTAPNYYLRAINASLEPVKMFAVVYLSDKNGNPIDINGKPISLIENSDGETNYSTLVVFAITDVSESGMMSITIDNFVENMNFYTIAQSGVTISDYDGAIEYNVENGAYIKRNNISSYTNEEALSFSSAKLEELQNFLTLKMLYGLDFTLYATNFELDAEGNANADENDSLDLTFNCFGGKTDSGVKVVPITKSFTINTKNNKQIAFNYFCNNFLANYQLNVQATNSDSVSDPVFIYETPGDDTTPITKIKFVINAQGKNGDASDFISITTKPGTNAIDALTNKNEFVNWKVTTPKVENVYVFDENIVPNATKSYYKLYGAYSSNENDNSMQFGMLSQNSIVTYYLKYFGESSEVLDGSIDDNISYYALPNIFATQGDVHYSDVTNIDLNSNIVDVSQAIYDQEVTDAGMNQNLLTYWNYYARNTNNISITYLNPKGIAQLTQDLVFNSQGGSEYIYVGKTKFAINNTGITINGRSYNQYITVDGQNYGIEGSGNNYTLTIKSGDYFPIVKDYQNNGNDIMMILGQEFTITQESTSDGLKYVISNTEDNNPYYSLTIVQKISTSQYDTQNYINDRTKEVELQSSATALNREYDDVNNDVVKSITVNFVNGGIEKDNNNYPLYVADSNGRYKFVESVGGYYTINGKSGNFVLDGYSENGEDRYSVVGEKAFLMITFDDKIGGLIFDKPVTKVITYELIQEPIILQAYVKNVSDTEGSTIPLSDNMTTSDTQIEIGANTTTEISLKTLSKIDPNFTGISINLLNSSVNRFFFKHCTFKIEGNAKLLDKDNNEVSTISAGYTGIGETGNNILRIKTNNSYSNETIRLEISYTFQGINYTKYLSFNAKPNYSFKFDKNNTGISSYPTNIEYYLIRLNQGSYLLNNIISGDYFVYDSSINSINLSLKNSNDKYAEIVGDTLILTNSFANIDPSADLASTNPKIVRDYTDLIITLKHDSNDEGLIVSWPLRIEINPTYTLDFRILTNSRDSNSPSVNILNGQNIFDESLIKIYNGYSYSDLVSPDSFGTITSNFKLYYESSTNVWTEFENGIVNSDTINEDKVYKLKIEYTEGTNTISSGEFYVNVRGYEIYSSIYGQLSNIGSADRYDSIETTSDDTIKKSLYFNIGDSINIDNYYAAFTKDNLEVNAIDNLSTLSIVLLKTNADNTNSIFHDFNVLTEDDFGQYRLGVAKFENSTYVLVKDLGNEYKINIYKITEYYSNEGNLPETDMLDAYILNDNLVISNKSSGETIDLDKYYRIFSSSQVEKLPVVLVNANNAEDSATGSLTIPTEKTIYNVCYKIGDNLFETGYTCTIIPATV